MTNLSVKIPSLSLSIAPYIPSPENPWNEAKVKHVYNRLGFGANREEIQAGLQMTPGELIDQLLDGAEAHNLSSPPNWADWTNEDYDGDNDLYFQHKTEFRIRWLGEMINEGIKSKMALFWHNHFVTEEQAYGCNSFMWAYYKLLHDQAYGNFRSFVEKIGKAPAMMVYLNNVQNIKQSPNENYARELMELFTMGADNGYTQRDVEQVAKALTGWRFTWYECRSDDLELVDYFFDEDIKTIFGISGFYGYDDVHELIFTRRSEQVSKYITGKIMSFFAYEKIDPIINDALATTFKDSNWEIMPVLKQLFKSEYFFNENLIGANIKSPIENIIGQYKMTGLQYPDDIDYNTLNDVNYYVFTLGQELFNPINVAGWKGYRTWLNENTLTSRWNISTNLSRRYSDSARGKLLDLALELSPSITDPVLITQAIASHFLNHELEPNHLATAVDYLKGEIPENYFEDGSWNLYFDEAPDQLINLLYFLMRLPEYQLS